MRTCWARTSASLPAAAPLPPLRVEEEEEDAVEEVVVVVEEVPWMARLIQCSMLMLPSRLDEITPPPPSSSSPSPPSPSLPSPCPSPSEHEEVSKEEQHVKKLARMIQATVTGKNGQSLIYLKIKTLNEILIYLTIYIYIF